MPVKIKEEGGAMLNPAIQLYGNGDVKPRDIIAQ
jgi:hypothetical protein